MASRDVQTHYALQLQEVQKNLSQAERDLAAARQQAEELRHLLVRLGQAFAPDALLPSGDGTSLRRVDQMEGEEIYHRIETALQTKLAKLTAFASGLTPEQQARWIERTVASRPDDWMDDPAVAQARRALEQERAARLAAEQAARDAERRAQQMEEQQASAGSERLRLVAEMQTMQNQIVALQASNGTVPQATSGLTGAAAVSKPGGKTLDVGVDTLLFVIATRGICERPRIAEVLHREFEFGDSPNCSLINTAFEKAEGQFLDVIQPRAEAGIGHAPHLVRLSETGIQLVRERLGIEPARSDLTRLLERHDSPEHVMLILQARALFEERYPEPVGRIDLFPAPILLDDGKRSEADLAVTLESGHMLLVECERDTPKNRDQRKDKWAKYYAATDGEFNVVCPDPKTVQNIVTEITRWQVDHGGHVRLRATSVQQVRTSKEPGRFWFYDREH